MDALLQLPNEVLEGILLYLPALSHSETSVETIHNFGLGNSRFLAVSQLSSVWKSHYETRWLRSDPVREEERRLQTENNFWKMYSMRRRSDLEIMLFLEGIISDTEKRQAFALELVRKYKYDLWDVLSAELEYPSQGTQGEPTDVSERSGIPVAGLTRRYWAREVLNVLAILHAVNTWLSMRDDLSLEQGLACLCSFFGEDINKIYDEFDILAQNCRAFLSDHGITEESKLEDVAILICSWMRSRGFVKASMTTLPISLVYVFVCVACRLGYDAHPVAFPYKVLAVISPHSSDPVYVDVFDSATRPILTYNGDLLHTLESQGLDPNDLAQHASPASTATMLLRAAGNIMQSLELVGIRNNSNKMPARYAACCVALIVTGDERLVQPMLLNGMCGPFDAEVVMRNALRPNISLAARQEMDMYLQRLAAASKQQEKPRLEGRTGVKYLVGTVFRHKTYGYVGLIRSWDYSCEAREEWIRAMRIDHLPRGRNQAFYHGYTTDGSDRYVAEENIEPLSNPSLTDINVLINNNKDLGRWFDGVRTSRPIRLILSSESRMLYPDDDLEEATMEGG